MGVEETWVMGVAGEGVDGEGACFLASGDIEMLEIGSGDDAIGFGLFLPLFGGDFLNRAPLRKEATVNCGGDLGMGIPGEAIHLKLSYII